MRVLSLRACARAYTITVMPGVPGMAGLRTFALASGKGAALEHGGSCGNASRHCGKHLHVEVLSAQYATMEARCASCRDKAEQAWQDAGASLVTPGREAHMQEVGAQADQRALQEGLSVNPEASAQHQRRVAHDLCIPACNHVTPLRHPALRSASSAKSLRLAYGLQPWTQEFCCWD